MTQPNQKSLDEAASRAGYRSWNDALDRCASPRGIRSIQAHASTLDEFAAYKREVSDAVEQAVAFLGTQSEKTPRGRLAIALARFIIAKPDPLVEALVEAYNNDSDEFDAANVRAAIEKRGGKIVWGETP